MTLEEFAVNLSYAQQKVLSGGITCDKLKITDNGSGQLMLAGNVNITIKILDLTTEGASRLPGFMSSTQQMITSKLKGDSFVTGFNFLEYNSKTNTFSTKKVVTYSIWYHLNYIVKLEQIKTLNQLLGNDFVIAVVDSIGLQFKSGTKKIHNTGGLSTEGGPVIIQYDAWKKEPNIAVHEFFHTLGLDDLEDPKLKNRLMYHLDDRTGTSISNTEKTDMNRYLMRDLLNMVKVHSQTQL